MTLIDRGSDWKIKVKLRRESEMLDWLKRLQRAMESGAEGAEGR